jgi:hypothetical protein
MHRDSGRPRITTGLPLARLAGTLLGICCALALPAGAAANNLFSLDSQAASAGPIVTESKGTGYVAWERQAANSSEADTTIFCKIPRGGSCASPQELHLPGSGKSSEESPSAAFPVLGASAGVVYVVAPRYVEGDTLIWTSEDGGEKFSAAKKVSAYAEGSGVGDVLRNPLSSKEHPTSDVFDVASFNSKVGFTEVGDLDSKPFSLRFAGDGDGQGSTLGFTASGLPVEAYWNFASPYEVAFNYLKGGNASEETNWSAPLKASDGYEPRLASGPSGLFLLSTDVASGEEQPTLLDVRKYNETTHSFGSPINVTTVAPGVASLFTGGEIFENPETGTLYVVQPIEGGSGYVMHLWESTDAGASFHGEREIATANGGYEGPPRLAVAADGQGWLTFKDGGGLEVADLNSLSSGSSSTMSSTPVTTVSPPPVALAPTKLTTVQSGGGVNGGSLTVPQGTTVIDQAQISGALAASATGAVSYTLYKDSKCTVPAAAGGTAPVARGLAGPSAPVKPKAGRYYWQATYSGDSANAGSATACGSEILVVALSDPNIGLPPSNMCLSRRHFVVHPRAPRNVTLVSVEIQINGKIVKRGKLSKQATTVSLLGLPKGTFRVALITKSSKGKLYEDIRTFHTCVPGKHKKKK